MIKNSVGKGPWNVPEKTLSLALALDTEACPCQQPCKVIARPCKYFVQQCWLRLYLYALSAKTNSHRKIVLNRCWRTVFLLFLFSSAYYLMTLKARHMLHSVCKELWQNLKSTRRSVNDLWRFCCYKDLRDLVAVLTSDLLILKCCSVPTPWNSCTAVDRSWPITDTDSVLCTLKDHAVLQSLNTIIAPPWQFRL